MAADPTHQVHHEREESEHSSQEQANERNPRGRHNATSHGLTVLDRVNLDSSVSIRYVCTTEQRADILTKGAFTTIQSTSLMRLFDTHPPFNLNFDRNFSESSYSTSRCRTPTAFSVTSEVDRGKMTADSSNGVRFACRKPQRNNNLVPQVPLGETHYSSSHCWKKTQCVLRTKAVRLDDLQLK